MSLHLLKKSPVISRFSKPAASLLDPLTALATLTLLSLLNFAGLNRAADADSQKDALKTGGQLWMENCTMCHEERPRIGSSAEQLDVIKHHMREEADLSPDEEAAILRFLETGN